MFTQVRAFTLPHTFFAAMMFARVAGLLRVLLHDQHDNPGNSKRMAVTT